MENRSSPFVSSNPLYDIVTQQNFAKEEIQFAPTIEVLEMLFQNMAFGNFFINVIDFRDYTYPYNSPNSVEVMGYTPGQMTNLDWLITTIDPNQLAAFMDYTSKIMTYITALPTERKRRVVANHCFRVFHGVRKEYFWLYQQNHMSYIDTNGAIVYSISSITDVTHLHGTGTNVAWSLTERMEDGSCIYLIGSESDQVQMQTNKALLTTRETEILNLSARGFGNQEIAKRLGVGYQTIITHRKKILKKTRSKNMPEAVAFAINLGYL